MSNIDSIEPKFHTFPNPPRGHEKEKKTYLFLIYKEDANTKESKLIPIAIYTQRKKKVKLYTRSFPIMYYYTVTWRFYTREKKCPFFRCVYYTIFFPATPSAASRKPDDPTHTVGAQQERVFVTISHFWSLYIRRHHNNNCMRSARKIDNDPPPPTTNILQRVYLRTILLFHIPRRETQ